MRAFEKSLTKVATIAALFAVGTSSPQARADLDTPPVTPSTATSAPLSSTLNHPIPTLADSNVEGPIVTLTLEESVASALQSASSVQRSQNDRELTGTQLIQAYAQFLPNLQTAVGYNNVEGSQYFTTSQPTLVDGHTHGLNYSVSSTLNIFNGFSDISGLQSSLARKHASELSVKRAKQQIALDISQSYLQVILDKRIVRIADRNLASSRERERLLEAQTKVGTRSIVDLYRQQAQTSSDESFFADSQNKERTDEILLVRKLRMDPARKYELKDADVDNIPVASSSFEDESKLIGMAVANRPDLQAQDENVHASASDLRMARSAFYPKIDFSLGVTGGARALDSQLVNGNDVTSNVQGYGDQMNERVWTAGITLTWTIFDRWMTRTAAEKASVAQKNAHLDLDDLHNQVVGEVRQAYGDYRTVVQQVESSRKGLVAAQKGFEATEARYKVGAASFIDLLTAQAALVSADAARAQATISFALKAKVIETVTGTAKTE